MQVLQWNGDMYPMIEFTECSDNIEFFPNNAVSIYTNDGGRTSAKIGDYIGVEDENLYVLVKQDFIYSTPIKRTLLSK
jgi:hypothetical protein